MVITRIPTGSPLLTKSIEFVATFNPTSSGYNFDAANNKNINIFKSQTNSVYIWEKMSFAASIDESSYLKAIVSCPEVIMSKGLTGIPLNRGKVNLNKYTEGKEIINYFSSFNASESINVSCSGSLKMISELLDFNTIKLYVTFSVWQINEKEFLMNYNSDVEKTFSQGLIR